MATIESTFYSLGEAFDQRAMRAAIVVGSLREIWDARRGELPARTMEFGRESGKHLFDVVWTSVVAPLISHRLINELRRRGITGWDSYPVKMQGTAFASVSNRYEGLMITGRCSRIEIEERIDRIVEKRDAQGRVWTMFQGLYVDSATWDGSDMFMGDNETGFMVVTERVKELFQDCDVRNCRFTPIFEVDVLATDKELLSRYNKEART